MSVLIPTQEYVKLLEARHMILQHMLAVSGSKENIAEMLAIRQKLALYNSVLLNGDCNELTNLANVQVN